MIRGTPIAARDRMNEPIFDSPAIAARIRSLIFSQDAGDVGQAARRLLVDEVALRISVDELAPYPTLDVLAAVVEAYGVDPAWLITGEYDLKVHRVAISSDRRKARSILTQLLSAQLASANIERPRRAKPLPES
jgi:hypothetical protein